MGRKDGRTDDGLTGRKRPGGSDRSLGESSCTQNKQTNRERERERERDSVLLRGLSVFMGAETTNRWIDR